MTGADLFNTASVSYRDPAGVLRTGISNMVTVVVSNSVDIPPDPDLSGLDGKTYALHDTITLPYHGTASGFNWVFIPVNGGTLGSGSRLFNAQAASQTGVPYFTPAPSFSLATVSLTIGRFIVKVQAINGIHQSSWMSATVTFVNADLAALNVFPNPFRAARGDTAIHFEGLSTGCTVKIFTVSGRLVQTLSASGGSVPWDLTNESGEKAAAGLYLYLITDGQGNKLRGKLALIR